MSPIPHLTTSTHLHLDVSLILRSPTCPQCYTSTMLLSASRYFGIPMFRHVHMSACLHVSPSSTYPRVPRTTRLNIYMPSFPICYPGRPARITGDNLSPCLLLLVDSAWAHRHECRFSVYGPRFRVLGFEPTSDSDLETSDGKLRAPLRSTFASCGTSAHQAQHVAEARLALVMSHDVRRFAAFSACAKSIAEVAGCPSTTVAPRCNKTCVPPLVHPFSHRNRTLHEKGVQSVGPQCTRAHQCCARSRAQPDMVRFEDKPLHHAARFGQHGACKALASAYSGKRTCMQRLRGQCARRPQHTRILQRFKIAGPCFELVHRLHRLWTHRCGGSMLRVCVCVLSGIAYRRSFAAEVVGHLVIVPQFVASDSDAACRCGPSWFSADGVTSQGCDEAQA